MKLLVSIIARILGERQDNPPTQPGGGMRISSAEAKPVREIFSAPKEGKKK